MPNPEPEPEQSQCQGFWQSEEAAQKYPDFATKPIPSNRVAHLIIWNLISQEKIPLRALGFGCNIGARELEMKGLGIPLVYAVDNNPYIIEAAKKILGEIPGLHLEHINDDQEIPCPTGGFDIATMLFVHPTIPDVDTLYGVFERIRRVLMPSGRLITLGLNPLSFSLPPGSFKNYELNLPTKEYVDGGPLGVTLKREDGTSLSLIDTAWTSETLRKLLTEAGFSLVEFHTLSLTQGCCDPAIQGLISPAIEQVQLETTIDLSLPAYHEFQGPKALYRLGIAYA